MHILFLALVLAAVPQSRADVAVDGSFTLRAGRDSREVNLNLQYEDGRSNYGRNLDRSELSNVTPAGDRITFTLRREPGTFTFEGRGTIDRASGWYDFVPNAEFQRGIEKLGFRDVDERSLFAFALDGLTIEKVRQLQRLVSDTLDTPTLVRLINHGAGVKYIQAMTDIGFKNLSSGEYRKARDHGVSADLAREMADLGMKLSLQELIRTRDHGVTTEFVRAMRAAGYRLSHDELIRTRDHGVTVDFIKRMGQLGYDGLDITEYVRMRDHGVTTDYVDAMRDAGYSTLTPQELVRLRDHGVTASYVRRVKDMLKEAPTVEQLIRMRNSGAFVR